MSVKIGEKVEDFTLKNNKDEDVSLSDYKGKYVLIYFYPKDETPGCTLEACSFRDNYDQFKDLNVVILGISKDNKDSHEHFISKYELPFQLLTDSERKVCTQFNTWGEKKNYGKIFLGLIRSTFLIDPNGILVKEWRNVRAKGHVERVLKELQTIEM